MIPFVKFFCGIIWGITADKYRCKRLINIITTLFSTLIICLLAFDSIAKGYKEVLIISVIASTFTSDYGVLDAYCLDLLGDKHKSLYGNYRAWVSISYGLGSVLMGIMTTYTNKFEWNFMIFAIFEILKLIILIKYIPE